MMIRGERSKSGEYNDTNTAYTYMIGEDPEALTQIESRRHFGSSGCGRTFLCWACSEGAAALRAAFQPAAPRVLLPEDRTALGGREKARAQRTIATPEALPVDGLPAQCFSAPAVFAKTGIIREVRRRSSAC